MRRLCRLWHSLLTRCRFCLRVHEIKAVHRDIDADVCLVVIIADPSPCIEDVAVDHNAAALAEVFHDIFALRAER